MPRLLVVQEIKLSSKMSIWLLIVILWIPKISTSEDHCLNFVRISKWKDLEAVRFTNPVLLKDHDDLEPIDIKALQVPCIKGEHFASDPNEINRFLANFQKLRIFAKNFVTIHANFSGQKQMIESFNDMQRTFDLITPFDETQQRHKPPELGSRQLIFNFFVFWPSMFLEEDGKLRGVDLQVVKTLAKKFRFTYKFLPPGFSIDARELPNGSIVGVRPDVSSNVVVKQFLVRSLCKYQEFQFCFTMS